MSPAAAPAASAAPPSTYHAPDEVAGTREDVLVQRLLASDDFPAFSQVMSDLMASLRDDEASAQRLTNLVLRDYALTVKVIRTANTVHYNRSGRAVQSATHALMLLGARTVRDLASGLLLFEQYRRRSPGLKELMLLSLLTASHAREAAARRGSADLETAQLCGMFRNLGEVLVAAHLPEEYAEVLRRTRLARTGDRATAPGATARLRAQAAVAILGCSFEDIGSAIARHWGMPEAVRRGMRATGAAGEDPVELSTAFAHDLASAIYREEAGVARDAAARVLELYGTRLALTRDALAAVADAAVAETRETFASARVALDDLRLARQVAAALGDTEAGDAAVGPALTPATGVPVADAHHADPAQRTEVAERAPAAGPALLALRERLAHDLAAAADDVLAYAAHPALLVALEAAMRGGPFDRACFCAADVRSGELRGRFGLGSGVESLLERLALSFSPVSIGPGSALRRGEEVFLCVGTRLSLADAQSLRAWGASNAALLPVRLGGATIGALYVDRASATALDAATTSYLRRVVGEVTRALALRRAAASAPTAAVETPTVPTPTVPTPTVPTPTVPPPTVGAPEVVSSPVESSGAAGRADLVLRVLRGEPIDLVAASAGVGVDELGRWREEFLAGAVARLSGL